LKSEKSLSDNYIFNFNSDIESLETNFNKIHLNNFKFVKNLNNCIEDKIYDNLKSKVKNFLKKENISIILRIIVLRKSVTNNFLYIE